MKKHGARLLLITTATLVAYHLGDGAARETKTIPPASWQFGSLLRIYGKTEWDPSGRFTRAGDLAIDFALKNGPKLSLQDGSRNIFKFDQPMPKTSPSAKVVFTTSIVGGMTARIPRFKPILSAARMDAARGQIIPVKEFTDYPGAYQFEFGAKSAGFGNITVVYLNCFQEGTEHYIFGSVELFGVKFKNEAKEPLVFKISNGKYVYVKGQGSAAMDSGKIVEFGR